MQNLRSRLAPLALLIALAGCSGNGGNGGKSTPNAFRGDYQGTYTIPDQDGGDILMTIKSNGQVSGKILDGETQDAFTGRVRDNGDFSGSVKAGDFTGVLSGTFEKTESGIAGTITEVFGEESVTATFTANPTPA